MTTCSSSDVLDALRAAGVTVSVEGDRLVLRPGAKVPEALKPAVRARKAEIIEALTGEAAAPPRPPAQDGPPDPDRTPWEVAARTLARLEPCSEEEAAFVHGLAAEGWSRRDLVELLNRDTARRWGGNNGPESHETPGGR